jgi:hypothetical protein
MANPPGRLERILIVVAVSSAAVLIALTVWFFATFKEFTFGPPTGTTTKNAETIYFPLGVRLDQGGSIELFVPNCPGVESSAAQWMSLELDRPVIWSIELKPGGASRNEFTLGKAPIGYITATQLRPGTSIDEFGSKLVTFIVVRRSNDGQSLRPAGLNIKADELPPGVLVYRSRDGVLHRVRDASEVQPSRGCDAA